MFHAPPGHPLMNGLKLIKLSNNKVGGSSITIRDQPFVKMCASCSVGILSK